MHSLKMNGLTLGQQYTSKELAKIWGYEDYHALIRGVVTEKGSNVIVLFITKNKAKGSTPYEDQIDGDILYMMGQRKHGTDQRIAQNLQKRIDSFYLFFREKHHTPYTYYGECRLLSATLKNEDPSEFEFLLLESISDDLDIEQVVDYYLNTTNEDATGKGPSIEGNEVAVTHIRRERDPHNRKEAIKIHGHTCSICGFDFNVVYGEELANNYIEVHHIKQLSEGVQIVDPTTDLIPVCSNCHKMLHRRRTGNITIDELKEIETVKRYIQAIRKLNHSY